VSLGTLTAATALAGVGIVIAAFVMLATSVHRLHQAGTLSARNEQTVADATAAAKAALNAAADERGFVATSSIVYLVAFNTDVATHDRTLNQLRRDLGPAGRARFVAIKTAVDDLVHGWAVIQVALARRDPDAARLVEARGRGLYLAAALDRRIGQLVADKHRVVAEARAEASASARRAELLSVGGLGSVIVIAGGYIVFLLCFVTRPIGRVRAAMDGIGAGELTRRLATTGVSEIGEIQRGFNAMADAILEQQGEAERANADLAARKLDVETGLVALSIEKDKAQTLYDFAQSLAADVELSALGTTMTDGMGDAGGADVVIVYALDEREDGTFHLLATRGIDADAVPAELIVGDGPAGRALAERRTQIDGDESCSEQLELRRVLHIPLIHAGQPLGIVSLGRRRDEPFAAGELEILGHMTDQSALALRSTLSRLHATRLGALNERLIESSRDGIRLIDLDGAILAQNTRMATMIGEATGSPPSRSFWEQADAICPRTADPQGFAAMTERIRANPGLEVVYEYELPEPGLVFSRFVAPVYDADGTQTGRIVALRDVTSERAAQRAKDEFVASVTHELRTPLTSISGYVELLLDDETGELTAEQRHFLEVVDRNSARLLGLVNDLLFVGQLESGMLELEPSPTDVAAILADAVEAARPAAESQNVRLGLMVGPVPEVVADGGRLGQLVDNLLSNAVKFTPPGGRVSVTAGRDGDAVTLRVADTGIGVPDAEKPCLFDRFFRASTAIEQAVPGTGLGLSITKAIAEAHGGSIAVEDTPGGGTTFRVELPLVAAPAKVAA
jgi:signal transduction histidine kinase